MVIGKPNLIGIKINLTDTEIDTTTRLTKAMGDLMRDMKSKSGLAKGSVAQCIIQSPNEMTTWLLRSSNSGVKEDMTGAEKYPWRLDLLANLEFEVK